MKIVVLNPNSSEIVSDVIMKSAQKKARPSTELIRLTNPAGTKNIDCGFADYMSTHSHMQACLEKVKEVQADAVVLAGFGNVGVYALKEALEIPVVSISEATMAVACLMGHKFSTVTMLKQFIPYQEDLVRLYGFDQKCASCRAININVERAASDREETLAELKEEVQRVVKEDGAEVIILACAGLCGYEDDLSDLLGIPVLDPVVVAVKVAEMMAETGLSQSKIRKFAFPPQPMAAYI
ncbi:hydantoin racemase [candidate division KSB3 bacterium]|uniref:Hydantoin racemase n=1 Tax=candidate division KSB3 bacterium TaxID=2044937 RepID=A0A9D5JSC5_9BACT|nr:hydantoin racemase [candidate division KSB3 bacterium]MBD3323230.1 hydantoin racemase [candidate division KSB3 bacterium]